MRLLGIGMPGMGTGKPSVEYGVLGFEAELVLEERGRRLQKARLRPLPERVVDAFTECLAMV
jgi:hypothetical protein